MAIPNPFEQVTITHRNMGGLTFDAVLRESHTTEIAVTDNPIENGVSITDHSYKKPDSISIEFAVTNTPTRAVAVEYGVGGDRIRRAYDKIRELMLTREPFDVQTGLRLYSNMICTRISVDQDARTANVLKCRAELREVVFANTQAVTYPERKAGAPRNQASKTSKGGAKQGATVDPYSKKNPSWAKSIFGG